MDELFSDDPALLVRRIIACKAADTALQIADNCKLDQQVILEVHAQVLMAITSGCQNCCPSA